MAESDHDPDGARSVPAATAGGSSRGRSRPVLALAALVPLLAAGGLLATSAAPQTSEVTRAEATSRPGAVAMECPGPLQVPEGAYDAAPDDELAVTPPSTAIDVGAVAFEPASNLLFGTVSASETLTQDDGTVRTPQLSMEGPDGEVPADVAAQDLGVSVQTATGLEGPARLQAATSAGDRPVADAVQTTATTSGDYRSLSMTRCERPTTEASFLGATTTTGSSSALVLRNPSDRAATAAVQLWTEEGPAAMEGRSQVVVPAGEEKRVLLESVAPGHDALGVDVDVLGAPLAMHVQVTRRDGLTPGGAEILSPLPPPSTSAVMPGVRVRGTAPTLLLANPAGAEATATVSVLGTEGEVAAAAREEVAVPSGAVVPLPLEELSGGAHTVRVESTSPVTAVTRTAVAGADLPGDTVSAPVDMTLVEPAPAIGTSALTALPAGGAEGGLYLSTEVDTGVRVIPVANDGSAGDGVDVDLTAGRATGIGADNLVVGDEPAAAIAVVPDEPGSVHASWLQVQDDGADGTLLSSVPLLPADAGTDPVTVRLTD